MYVNQHMNKATSVVKYLGCFVVKLQYNTISYNWAKETNVKPCQVQSTTRSVKYFADLSELLYKTAKFW